MNNHVYHAAYRRNLLRTVATLCAFVVAGVAAACLGGYSDLIPLAAVPLAVFSIVKGIILNELVKARRSFENRGNVEANESLFDAEYRSETGTYRYPPLCLTPNWLFSDAVIDTFLVPAAEISWMYEKRENNAPSLVIHFGRDSKAEYPMPRDRIEEILAVAAVKYPHVVVGYSKELANASENDKAGFRKKLAAAPRVILDTSSPFRDPYYETIVYAKVDGKRRRCLLALTRESRLVLVRGGKTLFDRGIDELESAWPLGFGRLHFRFGAPDWARFTVKTYNVRRWRSLLAMARRGAALDRYAKKGYSNVDSYNFVVSQNRYYMRYVAALVSLLFFSVVLYFGVKDDMLWEDGIPMGIATYILLPFCLPPLLIYGYARLSGFEGVRAFPVREETE